VLKDLKDAEIAWLLRFYDIFDRKLNLNMSEEQLIHKFPSHRRGDARTMFQRLRAKGYFYPHGGRDTYFISRDGADKAEEYKRQLAHN
jgi:hypothetical protein